ncbi:MAG: DNA strand exchange inhibitor protein [Planctomycetes bacterium]|nr:DNA strand exchange inhibitor protein [Planctomycetota bacterium]
MNDATLRKLEFDEIREVLAGQCATALGQRLARSLKPTANAELVRLWLGQVRELAELAEEAGLPPLGGVHDVRTEVRASSFPTPLEADALARVAETLAATGPLRKWIDALGDRAPALRAIGERVADLTPIAAVINEAIDTRGQVRDYATPKLASIRSAIESARGRVKIVFDRILRQTSLTRMLQYAGATFHDDRMVLPLKAEHRGRIPGIIHRSSDSGSTLFVEPAESVELNNSIVRLRDEESKEITHILRGLTQRVQLNAESILATLRGMGVLDLIAAKCRYAKSRRCTCAVVSDDGVLALHEGRHPVLLELFARQAEGGGAPRQVVPIDIRLGEDFDVLVVTGPNTGGKTVAIKTVGLLAAMTQCGIPIPAGEGSTVPVYDAIHIDVGDEQSLQQSLSTFSSHLSNLLHLLGHSGPRSLVLIDELGAGTDPDEGAAIGRAVLDELLRLGAKAVVTTHLSALKAVAFTTPRVDNAAVEFDVETLKPTYRVRLGEPGNSNALVIAKRLGMPARLVKLAKDHFDDRTRALNRAIAGTLESRREAEEARKSAREAALEAQRRAEQYEKQRADMARSQEAFERWTEWVNALQPGDEVVVKSLRRPARVVRMQLHKQMALVSTGRIDIEVPLRDIDIPAA